MAERSVRLWRAVPMSKKFIVQLSAVVIRQVGPYGTCLFMLRSWHFSKEGGSLSANISQGGGIVHQPAFGVRKLK